jgi:hypothetical protein
MKLTANNIYINYLPDGKSAIGFTLDEPRLAKLAVEQYKDKAFDLTISEIKSKRTQAQNRKLWQIIESISTKLYGDRTDENLNKVYCYLLKQTNIKRVLIATTKEALPLIEQQFRAILLTGQTIKTINTITNKESELITLWAYSGSSSFNTKEMSELIDLATDYAYKVKALTIE